VVSAETIGEALRDYTDPQQCVERLVQLALRGGGPDNITVVIADATDQDILEAAPIVGGAAARDRGMATSADRSTPAARASALSPPRPASPEQDAVPGGRDDESERPRRHPVRTALLLVVVLGLVGGGLWVGWSYTQRQYYVGATKDGQLAVFQGVPGQIAGLDLSNVHSTSAAELDDLTAAAQEQVKQGIEAKSEPDAQRRLAELTNDDPANPNLKPICSPTPTGAGEPSGTPTATPGPTTGATADPRRTETILPSNSADAVPSDTVPPVPDPAGCRSTE
jgi:hypothetical protein